MKTLTPPVLGRDFVNDGVHRAPMNSAQISAKKHFQEKLRAGDYRMVITPCLCGAGMDDAVLLSRKDRYGLALDIWLCKRCTLIYANPYMDSPSLARFYANDYRDVYEGELGPTDRFFQAQYNETGLGIIRFLRKIISEFKNLEIFEIGCGAGGNLKVFAEQGARCTGCDLDTRYLSYGQSKGLNLIRADFLFEDCVHQQFDLVILSHVLEHLRDPRSALKKIKTILKPGGHFYIEVPNVVSSNDFLGHLQNAHLWYFDRFTLEVLLKECGFEPIAYETYSVHMRMVAVPSTPGITTTIPSYEPKLTAFKKAERLRSLRRAGASLLDRMGIKTPIKKIFAQMASRKVSC